MVGPYSLAAQPQSRLLSLPQEIRLGIFDYMSLAPTPADQPVWLGTYFTCRQLFLEMSSYLKPATSFKTVVDNILGPGSEFHHGVWAYVDEVDKPLPLKLRRSKSSFDLVRCVTLFMPWRMSEKHFSILRGVYALFVDHIRVKTSVSKATRADSAWG